MARGHLFVIVVLLAAAAVAAVLAVTRTTARATPAASADTAIAFRLKRLDGLEASLERQLARQHREIPSAPVVVYTHAPTRVAGTTSDDEGHGAEHGEERDD